MVRDPFVSAAIPAWANRESGPLRILPRSAESHEFALQRVGTLINRSEASSSAQLPFKPLFARLL